MMPKSEKHILQQVDKLKQSKIHPSKTKEVTG